ncbi:MAG: hypothetical protein A3C02_00685 [Candidatus Andersenbacteria bacterium RIFCSPHIGHO2_02_FULL_45_11]|uniref:Uncharacterized protein n=1 Tax=Candidatus Andersenbacteria bacterium RIFCSPHIGHO2_12_FULL_45_11 TaxID=1797281 RepID=A0A1G1X405_9BACT|nr:MAG: hypothetical protein A2805_02410 [Candidatus Andersenbacteria bacterium RIFCSPHIGHO2_01_FULL_46_36]OGY32903.1 MAG: hypothetical protein A3C02_00685 [Candidatus Andersenbacteria bacterium RIFCSPHIGHO2_02_FULL_45_11]OGY34057.1 MAG: hypothetical protein A3D99_02260 [Candidatus Andersenbacteria bacterium RIFCSPHIGHO2_12_FULL_45_11]
MEKSRLIILLAQETGRFVLITGILALLVNHSNTQLKNCLTQMQTCLYHDTTDQVFWKETHYDDTILSEEVMLVGLGEVAPRIFWK